MHEKRILKSKEKSNPNSERQFHMFFSHTNNLDYFQRHKNRERTIHERKKKMTRQVKESVRGKEHNINVKRSQNETYHFV